MFKTSRVRVTVIAAILVIAGSACKSGIAAEAKAFDAPQRAATELATAVKASDTRRLAAILGADARAILESGDAVADRAARERFARAYDEANKLETSGDAKVIVTIGKDAWPFPIPIVKDAAGWRFDVKAGQEEILNRRIGRNELSTIQATLAYVDAQREYYLRNPDNDKLLHYAGRFVSGKGKRDGLYFLTKPEESPSPLGPLFDSATDKGYRRAASDTPAAYHGYHFRILKAQGPDAPGGAYSYVVRDRMIGGHGLVAWPANYGNVGIMTFIVNHDGIVYEKDLGPETPGAAGKLMSFNPDRTWRRVVY